MEVVETASPSGAATKLKSRIEINFGSLPAPFTKEVTAAFATADAGDLVEASAAQALAAGVFLAGGRVTATGVVGITIGTPGGTTVTPNTVTVDVYVTKGSIAT